MADVKNFLIAALAVAFIGGILGLVVGPVLTGFAGNAMVSALLLIAVGAAILWLSKTNKLDNKSFVEWIVLFAFVVGIGSLFATVVPQVSGFLLTVGSFTVTGLAFTVLYILVAEWILRMAGYKVK